MAKRVVILGGGVAGISAAVQAVQRGWQPVVLERTPHLGGRARSFFDKSLGCILDNGQHALSASYNETLSLLKTLNATDLIRWQRGLDILYRFEGQRTFRMKSMPLPAPLHFLLPLLLKAPLTRPDRRFLWHFGKKLPFSRGEDLRDLTVSQWLAQAGNAPFLQNLLWEPLTLATLNTPLHQASAELLFTVLQQAFLSAHSRSGLGIPAAGLSGLFGDPATAFLAEKNAIIRLSTAAKALIGDSGQVKGIKTRSGEEIFGDAVISTLPHHALAAVLGESPVAGAVSLNLDQLRDSPILTIYLKLSAPLPGPFPAALVASPLQWLFESSGETANLYAGVISDAREFLGQSRESILNMVVREIR
ncbi:MAG TPA: FAD-dependent oxidoreductase, partial [Calditrichia bacterium]|nr:FAD-dependent oxidoreductase [Calditrichia bacterium]